MTLQQEPLLASKDCTSMSCQLIFLILDSYPRNIQFVVSVLANSYNKLKSSLSREVLQNPLGLLNA